MKGKFFILLVFFFFFISISLSKNVPYWIEYENTLYGAKSGNLGLIGGGNDYENIIDNGDYIAKDLDGLLDALSKAKQGDIVFIPDETIIDLTTRIFIEKLIIKVPEGVTLAGNRGQRGSQGALLSSDALDTPVMILANGPNVRVTGIRIKGPNQKKHLEHHNRSFGALGKGRDYYYKFPYSRGIQTEYPNLEVDNCEIYGFSHAGIYLINGNGHHIHHNFIHHCQYNGLGYGICHNKSESLIEYNLFNWNRHSIAGTGKSGSGYIARNNIQKGESLSHCFDMHGGRDRGDGTKIAGSVIKIHNNTFLSEKPSVVIRGIPEIRCDVYHNWFKKHTNQIEAVKAQKNTFINKNLYGTTIKKVK
tara:strand:+ start:3461 stop:4546 length:1086 start_codon:yes stop_codon:yes gene_type:complete